MARPSKAKVLEVWMNGEHVGRWTASGRFGHRFTYDPQWNRSPQARPLSLSMPLRSSGEPYEDTRVLAFFDNLLPDNDILRREIMSHYAAASDSPFDLLAKVGRDCVGAVQLLPEGELPEDLESIHGETLREAEVADLLRAIGQRGVPGLLAIKDLRVSIAGAQEKTALLRHRGRWMKPLGSTPTTHIFKPPIGLIGSDGVDFTTSVENEWLCSRLLHAFGVPVTGCEMGQFENQKVLIVERFDRSWQDRKTWIARLPQEDFCQVTATPPGKKYENEGGPGLERILRELRGSSDATEDRLDFFRTVFLFWLMCAPDGHAKNFSVFLLPGGRFRLTPRYDVISAYPVLGDGPGKWRRRAVKMSMSVKGKNRHYEWEGIHVRHWQETAHAHGLGAAGQKAIAELIKRAPSAVEAVNAELPKGFPSRVADRILEGVRGRALRALRELDQPRA
jgi:serine/threonine-protein kinase HipA